MEAAAPVLGANPEIPCKLLLMAEALVRFAPEPDTGSAPVCGHLDLYPNLTIPRERVMPFAAGRHSGAQTSTREEAVFPSG